MIPHLLTIHQTQQWLKTSKDGLHASVAEELLKQYGKNELVEKEEIYLGTLLNQFKDVMIIILLTAAGISVAIGDMKDAAVILVIVF